MKSLFFALAFLPLSTVLAQDKTAYDKFGQVIKPCACEQYDGTTEKEFYSYYPSKAILAKYTCANKKLNGEYKEFYESGALKETINYKDGFRHGLETYQSEDGTYKATSYNKDGLREGYFKRFNKDGKVTSSVLFENNHAVETIYYHDNGVVSEVSFFRDNIQQFVVRFNEDGTKIE